MEKYLEPLLSEFKNNAHPGEAPRMKAYMKGKFEYYGIKAPFVQALLKDFVDEYGKPPYSDIEKIVFELFSIPQRELHYAAIKLCGMTKREWDKDSIDLFEKMAVTNSWWDSVDSVNSVCVRPFFLKFPEGRAERTLKWIDSGNMWLQRLSIIFQLRYKEKTDTKILSRNIELLRHSEEFFIQKAIGWALRDYGHSHPLWVIEYVERTELKPLSKREALKKLRD